MPKRRKYRMKGRGELQSIATANRNLALIDQLEKPKPPLQPLGQIVQMPITKQGFGRKKVRKGRMRGGAPVYVDRYGQYLHAY